MSPLPETHTANRFTFSLRTLLFVTTCVAAFLAARQLFVRNHSGELGTTIARAQIVSLMFAAAGSLYVCINPQHSSGKNRTLILHGGIAGGTAGLLVATCLGIEIAEAVRNVYPEYWNWSRDFIEFVWIIARVTIACIVVAVLTSSLYCLCGNLVNWIGRTTSRL